MASTASRLLLVSHRCRSHSRCLVFAKKHRDARDVWLDANAMDVAKAGARPEAVLKRLRVGADLLYQAVASSNGSKPIA